MNLKKFQIIKYLIVFMIILTVISKQNTSYSKEIYKLKPEFLVCEFNPQMSGAIIVYDDQNFDLLGQFRTNNDYFEFFWETYDSFSHKDLKYNYSNDFSNIKLSFDYEFSGFLEPMDSTYGPVLTITKENNQKHFIRLWNYVQNRPLDNYEIEISKQDNKEIRFPKGRDNFDGTNKKGHIQIDFDNLYEGYNPYVYDDEKEMWLKSNDFKKINPKNIKKISFSFVPKDYKENIKDIKYINNNNEFHCKITNWKPKGNIALGKLKKSSDIKKTNIICNYDNTYVYSPLRVVNDYKRQNYKDILSFYLGASKYYDKEFITDKFVINDKKNFNYAFYNWYKNYIKNLKEADIQIINSLSMELKDPKEDWIQRTYDNKKATTYWEEPTYLISFTNEEIKTYYLRLYSNLADLLDEVGLIKTMQLGEPWWWYLENDKSYSPCFYDKSTKELFLKDYGYNMKIFKSAYDDYTNYQDTIKWLKDKNGEFSDYLMMNLKRKYPNLKYTILFFPPFVTDENRVPKMMREVNFPIDSFKYPNLDFIMIEDYDYLINNELEKHKNTLSIASDILGYPPSRTHYFVGFDLTSKNDLVWRNITTAIDNGLQKEFSHIYIWEYYYVNQRGYNYPN